MQRKEFSVLKCSAEKTSRKKRKEREEDMGRRRTRKNEGRRK